MHQNEDWQTVVLATLVIIAIVVGILTVMSIAVGLIFMLLWNWVAPLWWATAPHLSLVQTCGTLFLLGIIVSIFKGVFSVSKS